MLTGRGSKVFRYGAEVDGNQFPSDKLELLVQSGKLELIEGSEDAATAIDTFPAEYRNFILNHSIEEVKAEFEKDLEAFPADEWKDIDNHEDLIVYISGKMAAITAKAKAALDVTEEESEKLDKADGSDAPADEKNETDTNLPAEDKKADGEGDNAVDEFGLKDKLNGTAPEKIFDKTFDEWTVPNMKEKLVELKIEFPSNALKADLWELLKKG